MSLFWGMNFGWHLGPNELEMAMIEEFGIKIVHGAGNSMAFLADLLYAGCTVMY